MRDKDYSDIINLPHHISKVHPRMSIQDRAAQFSPFAALTGHQEAINETARMVDEKLDLDEYQMLEINVQLNEIKDHIKSSPRVLMTYFKKDNKKKGGTYFKISDKVKKVDDFEQYILFQNGVKISFHDIYNIETIHYE